MRDLRRRRSGRRLAVVRWAHGEEGLPFCLVGRSGSGRVLPQHRAEFVVPDYAAALSGRIDIPPPCPCHRADGEGLQSTVRQMRGISVGSSRVAASGLLDAASTSEPAELHLGKVRSEHRQTSTPRDPIVGGAEHVGREQRIDPDSETPDTQPLGGTGVGEHPHHP